MSSWRFVLLAHGIVWSVLVFYLFLLKRRLKNLETELALRRSSFDTGDTEPSGASRR